MSRVFPKARVGLSYCLSVSCAFTQFVSTRSALGQRTVAQDDRRTLEVVLRYTHEFTSIAAARELSDGRVLASDPRERVLLALDASGKAADRIGREGDGPGEYRTPRRLLPLGGDSTLVTDGTNAKWYILNGARFQSLPAPFQSIQPRVGNEIYGVDRHGTVLSLFGVDTLKPGEPFRTPRSPRLSNRLLAVLSHITGAVDTIARLRGRYLGVSRARVKVNGESIEYNLTNPLTSHDQVASFPDGSVAIAYVSPYHVEIRERGGHWTRGAPIQYNAQSVNADVKKRVAENHVRNDDGTPVFSPSQFPPWPETIPPFRSESLIVGTDDRLYIIRTQIGDAPQAIDVFDRSARRVDTFALPARMRLTGAGTRGVYAAEVAEDGIEHLVKLRLSSADGTNARP